MPQSLQPFAAFVTLVLLLALALTARGASSQQAQQVQDERSLIGRLATVEPALRRVTVLPEGEADIVALQLLDDVEIWQSSRALTVATLVSEVGSRVKIRYRIHDGQRIAHSVTVEPRNGR